MWWYKIQLGRCIWICDVIQTIQVSWANQMWIYLFKLFKWIMLKFQRCQIQSAMLYWFGGWSSFIISEGKIWKRNSWFTFYWNWLATCICNNANTNRNLVFCYHQFCDYIQLHHLQLFLQLSYDYIMTIGGFLLPCGWFYFVFSFKNMVVNPIRHITN